MFPRNIQPRVVDALADTPVVLLSGPRQAGKTTLVRQLSGGGRRYLTLDDDVILIYDGTETLPLGQVNNRPLWAMPVATLNSSRPTKI